MATKQEDDLIEDVEVYINSDDGMPNVHPNIEHLEQDSDSINDEDNPLPKSIIVTNIHSEVFNNEKLKTEMENLFRTFSSTATFQWLRSFKRLRVNFDSPAAAANARIQLHQFQFDKSCISCYFAQPVTPVSMVNLKPPPLTKQFLISPPSSPPVGWEPREEGSPLVCDELLAALASMAPGECRELHAPAEGQPAIVVHTAHQPDAPIHPIRIPQTRCPDY